MPALGPHRLHPFIGVDLPWLLERIRPACNAQRVDLQRPQQLLGVKDVACAVLHKIAQAELRRMLQSDPPALEG